MDTVGLYLNTFETLRRRKRWGTDTNVLRFAALTLAGLGLDDPHTRLDGVARELRARAGWFGPLRSEVRHVVAAMILRRGLNAETVHPRVVRTREAFRDHGVRRRGSEPTFAALLLVLNEGGEDVPDSRIARLARILELWKKDHPWLTGADDLPIAAVHAARDESVESLAQSTEQVYRDLRAAGFRRGNVLQLVSQILAVDPRGAIAAAKRFVRIRDGFEKRGEKIRSTRYDELAILSLTSGTPASLAARVVGYKDRLRRTRPRPSKDIAFALATGLALADEEKSMQASGAHDLAALRSIQAMLDAQQAAVMAAVAATTAASAAAAAG